MKNVKTIFLSLLFFLNINSLFAQQEWEQIAKITAIDKGKYDNFGIAVDIDGDYAIVGSTNSKDSNGQNPLVDAGSAYIYRKEGNIWVQQQKLVPSVRYADDAFGTTAVAISGNYAIVSSRGRDAENGSSLGALYIFKREGNFWIEKQRLVAPVRSQNQFAYSTLDIEGDYIIAAAPSDSKNENEEEEFYQPSPIYRPDWWVSTTENAGAVYIFKRNGETWELQQKIVASDRTAGDAFGESLTINSNRIIAGAPGQDKDHNGGNHIDEAGATYIFKLEGETWVEEKKIVASDRAENNRFGSEVSISGNYATIANTNGSAFYIYYFNGEQWVEQQRISLAESNVYLNGALAIDGNHIIIGSYNDDSDENGENPLNGAGAAYVFKREGTQWIQERKLTASDRMIQASFGMKGAIDSGTIIVGAYGETLYSQEEELSSAGAAYLYTICNIPPEVIVTEETVCKDKPSTLIAVSEDAETINWYANATSGEILHTGSEYVIENATETITYWVEAVTEAGCISERKAVVLTVIPLPEIPVRLEGYIYAEGDTLADLEQFIDHEGALTWYTDEQLTEVIQNPETTLIVAGTNYYVTQTVGECVSPALQTGVGQGLGSVGFDQSGFVYYPNPVTDTLHVGGEEKVFSIQIFDIIGKSVMDIKVKNPSESLPQVDVSRLQSGQYIVKVQTTNGEKFFKIVKR